MSDQVGAVPKSATGGGTAEVLQIEVFDPSEVRPWKFHNRFKSGLDEASIDALAASIKRDGQQQFGLARRLPAGDTHTVEAIFGVRRVEACRRAGLPWRAEVRDASFSDAQCAALMHSENEWTESVSPLENAVQWKAMLDAGVFVSQSALAAELGCHRGTVSRAVRTATALFAEEWLARLVRPVMHEFTGRSADRLADAYAGGMRSQASRRRAQEIEPGEVGALHLYEALYAPQGERDRWETVFVRRKGGAGGGVVAAKIQRSEAGGWEVSVRPHEQTPVEAAELAEQVEAMLAAATAEASGVRLGRRLAASLSAGEAKDAQRGWLEGCVWAMAQASGLDWDRWRCAAVADMLRNQPGGWERAVARAVGGVDANPEGS